MLTIDRLAKIDSIATRIIDALYRGVKWVHNHYEDRLVDAAYLVAAAKAAAINKAEDNISDLEDAKADAEAAYVEAKAKLRADFERLVESLDNAQAKAEADMHDKIAAAALALVAADKEYEATVKAAFVKLDVEMEA